MREKTRAVHHRIAKQPHQYLMQKSKRYNRWHSWRWHPHVHVGLTVAGILFLVGTLAQVSSPVFALSSWAQSDWSGGAGPSTSTQYASASNANTSSSGHLTLATTSNWYNGSWKYRKNVTLNNTTANLGTTSEALTNFPILIKLTSSNFDFTLAQSAGQDIRFTDSDGTTALSYEIESWSSGSQTANIWVKVPQIDSNSSIDSIYIYYGNASATDGQTASSVWSGYAGVWHLNDPTNPTDSSGSGNNGTNHSSTATTGQVAGSANFANQYISTTNIAQLNGASTFTYSAWVKRTSVGSIVDFGKGNGSNYDSFEFWSDGIAYFETGTANQAWGTFSSNDTSWHYVQMVFDGTQTGNSNRLKAYMDGIPKTLAFTGTIAATTTNIDSSNFDIGRYYNSTVSNGSIDEMRVSSVARDAAYIAADYKSQTGSYATFAGQEFHYVTPATLTSNIFDTGVAEDWQNLTYTSSTPSGTSITVKVRAGNQADLSDASAFSGCSGTASSSDITSTCAPDKSRYVQYQLTLAASDATLTPDLQSISIAYSPSDTVAPPSNASSVLMFKSNGGASVSSNAWTNASIPYFTWTAGADDIGGSGIKGYCLYLGTDNTANVTTTKGLLGTSPVDTGGACQFAVSANIGNLAVAGYIGTALTTSNSPYYLLVKAIDNANNIYAGSAASFQFRFDNTPPTNPSFITAPSQFVSNKAVALTWSTVGGDAAADANSAVAGLQYRVGSSGTWYGDSHSGAQDISDLLTNDGLYTMQSSPDFANLVEGNNIIYFRTWDVAGNTAVANITTVIKINTTSPSSPQNLIATPDTNTKNAFAFSWLAPASFNGSPSNITYCYTVNTLPNATNCTYTAAGVTSLSEDAYATQPGDNTLYIVARDEASNINYATAANVDFTANTPAPGVPLNIDAADISVKTTSSWKLAISWEAPSEVGAGIANYKVYRSTDNVAFAQVASTSGASYVDSGLTQTTYYYKVKACDSANNCGALTPVVSKKPTGKFTSAAAILSGPDLSNLTTKKATISWVTDRTSDSKVAFGTTSGRYSADEIANSDQVSNHIINLVNLQPGTTYYYVTKWTDEDGNTGTSTEATFTTLPAPSISNVNVSSINLSSATIQFTSKSADLVKIFYGKSKDFGAVKTNNTSASESTYSVQLTGLDDGATYYYKINPFDSDGNEYDQTVLSFTTPARPRISNLRFQPVTDQPTSTQQITWDTNVPGSSELNYGPAGEAQQTAADGKLVTSHQMVISGLVDNKEYALTAQSRDTSGNLAVSDKQVFHTALDTRPPKISGVKVVASIKGTGAEAYGQMVVSWKTDEPATSQVAYGEGSSNTTYTNSTAEDASLVTNHLVIVSNLPTSRIFHLQSLSKDGSKNQARSGNYSSIVGDATDNVLSIVFNALQKVFGF